MTVVDDEPSTLTPVSVASTPEDSGSCEMCRKSFEDCRGLAIKGYAVVARKSGRTFLVLGIHFRGVLHDPRTGQWKTQ